MNIRTMRALDRFLGIPLCWVTGVWNFLASPSFSHLSPESMQTILVIKFFGLGSILLSTPFLLALARQCPHARIIYLTFSSNRELLEKIPLPLVGLTISTSSARRFLLDTLHVLRRLRCSRIDAVFDLEFFSKFSTLVSFFSKAPVRVGYDLPTRWRRSNLTHPVDLDHTTHVTQVFMRQIGVLGFAEAVDHPVTRLDASVAERASMERKLNLGDNGFELICININAGPASLERRWEPDRFAAVALALLERNPARRIFFLGGAEERSYVAGLLDTHPALTGRAVNCAGVLNVGELIALLSRSTLLLTNDSGPVHIASAVGTPVVALYGPESPRFYGPTGPARVVYKAIPCSPCLNIYNAKLFVCPYNARCMREISTDEVIRETEALVSVARLSNR
jgi:ADP-heptose:LPS heptosyltransferase